LNDRTRPCLRLQHPNISQVFDVGLQDGTHYFAMEHILGTNLRRLQAILIREHLQLHPSLALFIAAEVLDGLDCAHKYWHALTGEPLHVVHRDISPHNVMISTQGEVKIIDFGLAESTLKLEKTETAVVLGKIAYMSPEHARGEAVDARADQFAVGVVLYEMLAGERYYGTRVQPEIWAIAGKEGFVPDRMKDLDPEIASILMRALASKKDQRFVAAGLAAAACLAVLVAVFASRDDESDPRPLPVSVVEAPPPPPVVAPAPPPPVEAAQAAGPST
jgi:serine/threonine-protein kinase